MGHRNSKHHTQRDKILALFIAAKGGEVPLPALTACAAQYQTRLLELRRLGYRIPPPRVEVVNGQRHTWYRLESAAPQSRPMHSSPAGEELLFPNQPGIHRDDN
jgi:hypothetical protein